MPWLVETLASWAAGKALDAATTAVLNANGGVTITDDSPKANAIVNGADWLSNEWTYEYRVAWGINKNAKPQREREETERP